MRTTIVVLAVFLALGSIVPVAVPAGTARLAAATLSADQAQPTDMDINVDLNDGGAWYANPIWIAIGIVALIVVILLVVMAARGGGTTVIKD